MKPAAAAKFTSKVPAKLLRSMSGRTPQIELRGDVLTSPFAPERTGAVIAAGKFKATCLQLLDAAEKGESVSITKRGRIVARLVPPALEKEKPFVPLLGLMKGKIRILGDIVSPDFEAWGMEDPHKTKKK